MQKRKRFAQVNQKQCVGCGACIHVCPKSAISVPKGIHSVVDLEKCIGCGLCAKICPASVITIITLEKKEDIEHEQKEKTLV